MIDQIQNERRTKEEIAKVFPPEMVDKQFDLMIERKRRTAIKTAETVMIILKEIKNGSDLAQRQQRDSSRPLPSAW